MSFTGTLRPYQVGAVETMVSRGTVLLALEQGLGKAQPLSAPIPTPDGWTTIGRLQTGDSVFGSAGTPVRVTGVFPQGPREIWTVAFTDGTTVDCDLDHLWATRPRKRRHVTSRDELPFEVKSLRDLLQDLKIGVRPQIPIMAPLDLPDRKLPLDPYLLGYLIGNGSLGDSLGLSTGDSDLVPLLVDLLPDGCAVRREREYDWKLSGVPLRDALRGLRLYGKKSTSKFIPDLYLRAGTQQRVRLLQGLFDSDGYSDPDCGPVTEYTTSSCTLAWDVQELIEGLGGVTTVRMKKDPKYTYRGETRVGADSYRITPSLPEWLNPFSLDRKRSTYAPPTKYTPTRIMCSAEYSRIEEAVCISVDAPDSLYAADHFILTHNTPITIAAIEALNEEFGDSLSGLVLASSALRYQWADSIAQFSGGTMDEQGRWSGGSPVIVIDGPLDKRIELYERAMKEAPLYILLGYEQVVSDYAWVRQLPRDFLVADEVSQIKSPAAQRSQALKMLDSPFKFGLTGTPMENGKPDEIFSIMEWIDPSVLGRADLFDKTFVARNKSGWITGYRNLPRLHAALSDAMVRVRRDDPGVAQWMPEKIPARTHMVHVDEATGDLYNHMSNALQNDLIDAMASRSSFDVLALYGGGQGGGDEIQGQIASKISAMRMLLTDPSLLRASALRWQETAEAKVQHGSGYAHELLSDGLLDDLPERGRKVRAVVLRIEDVLDEAEQNKVIVFSFFKGALALLAAEFGEEAVQFHGGMNATQKAEAKRKFQHEPGVRVFLSSDAGGYGVDLPQANWLINVDLPFSKGKSDQRNSRHDRSSSHHAQIHTETFLVRRSIEEFYAARLVSKGGVARAIIDGKGYDRRGRLELSAATLMSWLEENSL